MEYVKDLNKILLAGLVGLIIFMFPTVNACVNDYLCYSAGDSVCVQIWEGNEVKYYLAYCVDTNNDGCFELIDTVGKMRECPYMCHRESKGIAYCDVPGCPPGSCQVGDERCYGTPDSQGLTPKIQACIDRDGDGCGEWAEHLIKGCPLYCNIYTGKCNEKEEIITCMDEYETCTCDAKICVNDPVEGYVFTCGQYDDDECCEWSHINYAEYCDETAGNIGCIPPYGTEHCPFGCDERTDLCIGEPLEPCESQCNNGEFFCMGDELFPCIKATIGGQTCWRLTDENGQNNNVTHCDWGCIEDTTGNGYCGVSATGIKLKELWPRGSPTPDNVYGITRQGNFIYMGNIVNGTIWVYDTNKTYQTSWDTNASGQIESWVTGLETDADYIYILELNGYHRWFYNKTYLDYITPETWYGGWQDIAEYGDYIYLLDGAVYTITKILKSTGAVIDQIPIDEKIIEYLPAYRGYGLTIDGDYFFFNYRKYFPNGTASNIYCIDRLNIDGSVSNPRITICESGTWYDSNLEIYGDNLYVLSKGSYELYIYSYGIGELTACDKGSTRCAGSWNVYGRWIYPYIKTCRDDNNDGYGEWEDGFTEECPFGCIFNETLQNAVCRASIPVNCTDNEKECKLPDATRCIGDWIWKCEDLDNNNCYRWILNTKCHMGCMSLSPQLSACRQCPDECESGESHCFPDGMQYVIQPGYPKAYKITYPVVTNCSYNYNLGCWLYQPSLGYMTRCNLGCYDTFNSTTNITTGTCFSQEQIEGEYHIINWTGSINEIRSDVSSYFDIAFPEVNSPSRYGIFILISGVVAGSTFIWSKGRGWKLPLIIFVAMIVFGSMINWLPIWITPALIVIVGLVLVKKFFWGEKE